MDLQKEVFLAQANLAEETHKPLIIHCVKAWADLIACKKAVKPEMPWIIHGFRGNGELASQLVRLGFYLSFGDRFNPSALRAHGLISFSWRPMINRLISAGSTKM